MSFDGLNCFDNLFGKFDQILDCLMIEGEGYRAGEDFAKGNFHFGYFFPVEIEGGVFFEVDQFTTIFGFCLHYNVINVISLM